MGERISVGMESGYWAAQAILQHFDSADLLYDEYRESTAAPHGYMKRQWSFVGGMTDTFMEMKL